MPRPSVALRSPGLSTEPKRRRLCAESLGGGRRLGARGVAEAVGRDELAHLLRRTPNQISAAAERAADPQQSSLFYRMRKYVGLESETDPVPATRKVQRRVAKLLK